MSNEKYALSPAAVEAINNMSGAYSAPFWDGILEVSGTLDTGVVQLGKDHNSAAVYGFMILCPVDILKHRYH